MRDIDGDGGRNVVVRSKGKVGTLVVWVAPAGALPEGLA